MEIKEIEVKRLKSSKAENIRCYAAGDTPQYLANAPDWLRRVGPDKNHD
jgi:hypothetical protein